MKEHVANVLSLTNLSLGFLSIFLSIQGYFLYAAYFILVGALLDTIDGTLARLLKVDGSFGKELDSFGDITSFGLAISIFIVLSFSNLEPYFFYSLIGLSLIFVISGVVRLSRFNISNLKGIFEGMPITVNGFVIPILYIFGFFTIYIVSGWLILSSVLMLSKFKIGKPSLKKKKKKSKEIELKDEEPEEEEKEETPIVPLPIFGD